MAALNVCPVCSNARWVTPDLDHYHGVGIGTPCPMCNTGVETDAWNRSCLACATKARFVADNPDDSAVIVWQMDVGMVAERIAEHLTAHYQDPRVRMVALADWDRHGDPFGYSRVIRVHYAPTFLTVRFCPELIAQAVVDLDDDQRMLYVDAVEFRVDHQYVYFELAELCPGDEDEMWRRKLADDNPATAALFDRVQTEFRATWLKEDRSS